MDEDTIDSMEQKVAALAAENARPKIVDTTAQMLLERGKVHGEYNEHADITQRLKAEMRNSRNWKDLSDIQRESLEMNAHKIGRILSGDPNHKDHWADLAGYAKLVEQRL